MGLCPFHQFISYIGGLLLCMHASDINLSVTVWTHVALQLTVKEKTHMTDNIWTLGYSALTQSSMSYAQQAIY